MRETFTGQSSMLFFTFLLCFFFTGCEKPPAIQAINGAAQGTTYSVKYWLNNDNNIDNNFLKQEVDKELARIDKLISNYRDDSVIEVFNQNHTANIPIILDKEILDLLIISADVHNKSKGCYDPTIKPLFQIWGFSDDKLHIPDDKAIAQAKQSIGFADKLLRDNNSITKKVPTVTIDFSAIGQGYAVMKIADLLNQQGIQNYLVEIGGEMLVAGTKPENNPWRVGVEKPVPNSQKISEIITLGRQDADNAQDAGGKHNTAIMTSGTYRHYFDDNGTRYSHILDPRTGKPVTHDSVAVTVLLDNAAYADAWSTALLCLGSQEGLKVANDNAIPAIFYDMGSNQQLIRHTSRAVAEQHKNWTID
ncbi:MAG: thiamine biosynthesis protein ApbE [Gammaproteobacteria bacterium]|nr:MAG: thiamine biosynthesis protein ApbE [Gammaproteobacteria bacterium]